MKLRTISNSSLPLSGVSASDYSCVPMQGSGTFALEAVLSTTVPRDGGKETMQGENIFLLTTPFKTQGQRKFSAYN